VKRFTVSKQAGVYMLRSRMNDASYVGASSDLTTRLVTHLSRIRNGPTGRSHRHDKVAIAFAGCTEADVEVLIIERFVSRSRLKNIGDSGLTRREGYWIRRLKPTVNFRIPKAVPSDDAVELPFSPEAWTPPKRPYLEAIARGERRPPSK
jgi:predicted GIY-YIG superfamily endonuclease